MYLSVIFVFILISICEQKEDTVTAEAITCMPLLIGVIVMVAAGYIRFTIAVSHRDRSPPKEAPDAEMMEQRQFIVEPTKPKLVKPKSDNTKSKTMEKRTEDYVAISENANSQTTATVNTVNSVDTNQETISKSKTMESAEQSINPPEQSDATYVVAGAHVAQSKGDLTVKEPAAEAVSVASAKAGGTDDETSFSGIKTIQSEMPLHLVDRKERNVDPDQNANHEEHSIGTAFNQIRMKIKQLTNN